MDRIFDLLSFFDSHYINSLVIFGALIGFAILVDLFIVKVIKRLVKFTKSETDDKIIDAAHRPIFFTILLLGLASINGYLKGNLSGDFDISSGTVEGFNNALFSIIAVIWAATGIKIVRIVLVRALDRVDDTSGLRKDVYPLADNLIKVAFVLAAVAAIIAIWNYDVTPLLASAGVAGVVIAMAAKDTFANFFGGISVFMDKPYKIGDYINLDTGERGEVVNIGMRSTRIKTRDDIQITLPNSVIANSKVINESQPKKGFRARIPIGVAYGSDVDLVENTLIDIAKNAVHVLDDPEPRVRFRSFGESNLDFELLCWVTEPAMRGQTIHMINKQIYKRFDELNIIIPFPQRDVHIFKGGKY